MPEKRKRPARAGSLAGKMDDSEYPEAVRQFAANMRRQGYKVTLTYNVSLEPMKQSDRNSRNALGSTRSRTAAAGAIPSVPERPTPQARSKQQR